MISQKDKLEQSLRRKAERMAKKYPEIVDPGPGDRANYVRIVDGIARMFVRVDGEEYPAEVLAWFYVHKRWPVGEIRFKNGDPCDCRLANLEEGIPV